MRWPGGVLWADCFAQMLYQKEMDGHHARLVEYFPFRKSLERELLLVVGLDCTVEGDRLVLL